LNISFPKNKKKEATLICKYLNLSAKKLDIQIIGGDTTSSKEIILSLTILSDTIKSRMLFFVLQLRAVTAYIYLKIWDILS
jgi:thiamine monophosphate kinase